MAEIMERVLKIDPDGLVQQAIDAQIAAGREIGVQVCAYLGGRLVVDTWSGLADPTTGRPVDGDTLFNVYSVTKAVLVTALHIQADRGLIDYDAPVAKYWPEFGINGKETTTVRHVITHRAGLPQMPEGVTVETICDWDLITSQIAALAPIAVPGSKALYQSMTFGWMVGELIRRTDPQRRLPGQFIREEIAAPLGITDLWLGLPDAAIPRFARHITVMPGWSGDIQPPLALAATPAAVTLSAENYAENAQVRRSGIPAVGGIFNARSLGRFFAMLAHGGELDGVRILSEEIVKSLYVMRDNPGEPDEVMYGVPIPMTIGGFWLGSAYPPTCSAKYPETICHPGFGNSIAWADARNGLAVAICHNRMSMPGSVEDDSILPIANAVRAALGIG